MSRDRRTEDEPRELKLEGAGLIVVVAVLVSALVGAFYLGRWVERRGDAPLLAAGEAQDESIEAGAGQTEIDQGFFDGSAEGTVEEPARQASPPAAVEAASATPPPTPKPAAKTSQPAAGAFYVQVFAGQRASAEELMGRLRGQGYPVRLDGPDSGGLHRVRVGGYADRAEADRARDKLKAAGFNQAWVTRLD